MGFAAQQLAATQRAAETPAPEAAPEPSPAPAPEPTRVEVAPATQPEPAAPAPRTAQTAEPAPVADAEREVLAQGAEAVRRAQAAFKELAPALRPSAAPVLDPEKDLVGTMRTFVDATKQQAARSQVAAAIRPVVEAATKAEAEFRKRTPDYGEATAFLRRSRAEQLEVLGMPAAQIPAQIAREQLDLASQSLAQGRNPAAIAYQLAKHNGYKPAAPKPTTTTTTRRQPVTAERLAAADMATFAHELGRMTEAQQREILGG